MELCLIWAQDRHRAIGRAGRMPWPLPEHLSHCRGLTQGSPVIMGRRTWQALGGKALPGRINLVLSGSLAGEALGGAARVAHLNDALLLAGTSAPARAFVIGGATVFARALPVAERVYLTEVEDEVGDADAFAPPLPTDRWRVEAEGPWLTATAGLRHPGLRYRFSEYRSLRRR